MLQYLVDLSLYGGSEAAAESSPTIVAQGVVDGKLLVLPQYTDFQILTVSLAARMCPLWKGRL